MDKHEVFVYANGIKCLVQCKCSSTLFYTVDQRLVCAVCNKAYIRQTLMLAVDN